MKFFPLFFFLSSCLFQSEEKPFWIYQLQSYDQELNYSKKLNVIDITYPFEVPKYSLCYLSIGEAEQYRPYFSQLDKKLLKEENKNWAGNFPVKYWEDQWQEIIFKNDNSYLNQIIEKNFAGVYLDIVDAFQSYEDKPKYAKLMAEFIISLSQKAKHIKSDFRVVIQNGIDIVNFLEPDLKTTFLTAIDGISLEAVLFSYNEKNQTTGLSPYKDYVFKTLIDQYPERIMRLSVEYIQDEKDQHLYQEFSKQYNLKPLITDKLLQGKYFKAP